MCACRSPSWSGQHEEALETVDGSNHGPTKKESCEATKTDETSCRESVPRGDGNRRAAQHPWSIDEHSLSLEDLDTPMDSPKIDDAEYLALLACLTDEQEPPIPGDISESTPIRGKTTGNAPGSGNDGPNDSGGYFWDCPSPYPPNFGSGSALDAALLEAPSSPCLNPFDCAGSSPSEAS